jgi:sugar lactone lactonase YvrE
VIAHGERRSSRLATETRTELGEGPVWDARSEELLWVDVPHNTIQLLDPATSAERTIATPRSVSAVVPRESGGLLVIASDGFATLSPESGAYDLIAAIEPDDSGTRMNDAACDSRGRCLAGTAALDDSRGRGSLYRLDPDGAVERLLDGVTESNGIGWTADDSTMFYVDTGERAIQAFDYDITLGSITNRRNLCTTRPEWGLPDGLVVDEADGVWVGFWGGSAIARFDSATGELTFVVDVPATLVTKGAFGGPALTDLYITTAREPGAPPGSAGGGLFIANPGVAGRPANRFGG